MPKICDWDKYHNMHRSKTIWVTNLLFCQNDFPKRRSFWQKDSLITHILFELWLIMIFSPVANFGQHPLCWKECCRFLSSKIRTGNNCNSICQYHGNCRYLLKYNTVIFLSRNIVVLQLLDRRHHLCATVK